MKNFIHSSVSRAALSRFFGSMKEIGCEIHTIQISVGGEKMLRIGMEPYSCTDAREIYSLSKSFTSTAVGIASDMGLLSDEEHVLKYFPEIDAPSEGFRRMKVRHLLSMNTGHGGCVMPSMAFAEESFRGFFESPLHHGPGDGFAYNTGATCLLGQILERASGMDFFDFLCTHLFHPLGIRGIRWSRCHDGASVAGAGLHISSDDIMKLGEMYHNLGVHEGRRILSEEWIRKASSVVSANENNGSADWTAGYGYQLWMNHRDGYRGDGACGQLMMILPKYDAVVAVQAFAGNMQAEIDVIMELMDSLFGEGEAELCLAYEPRPRQENVPAIDRIFRLSENPQGFKTLHLSLSGDGLVMDFSDADSVQTISAGNGEWRESSYTARNMIPTLYTLIPTEDPVPIRTAGCFTVDGGKITVTLRYLSNPHTETLVITLSDNGVKIEIDGARLPENCLIEGTAV